MLCKNAHAAGPLVNPNPRVGNARVGTSPHRNIGDLTGTIWRHTIRPGRTKNRLK